MSDTIRIGDCNAATEADAFAAKQIIALEKRMAALESALRDIRDMKFSPESMTGPVITLKSLARAALEDR